MRILNLLLTDTSSYRVKYDCEKKLKKILSLGSSSYLDFKNLAIFHSYVSDLLLKKVDELA